MAPKRKNANKQITNNTTSNTKTNLAKQSEVQNTNKKSVPIENISDAYECLSVYQDKKYNKRTISSNWGKYNEPVIDANADIMRGEDFQVLLSYSGGSRSQLQLQEEKEWDEVINEKCISLDLQDLAYVVKSIPFHKRLNLPEDIFDSDQIARFESSANGWKKSYDTKSDLQDFPSSTSNVNSESKDTASGMIDSYKNEEVNDIPVKTFELEADTSNIIESLTSCLSMKKTTERKQAEIVSNVPKSDDLDFLLCLNVSKTKAASETKVESPKNTNVDDWLNSILDD